MSDLLQLTDEHYTPAWIIDLARDVMGGIDLDPASCAEANLTVRAWHWYGREHDGLVKYWGGRVWCNPPGGAHGRLVRRFWTRLWEAVDIGTVPEFTWLAFNHSQLRTLQPRIGQCWICVLRHRLKFTGTSPTRDNAIVYWGPNHDRFVAAFREHGAIWAPISLT